MEYSVLISVYDKENPEYLDIALESMFNQTLSPEEVVIIEDGTLNSKLENIVNKYESLFPGQIRIIRRKENKGLGYSLNEGVIACKNEFIARMDSDDYSVPDRCEKQMKKLLEGYDLIGSDIDEFEASLDCVVSTKKMPHTEKEIRQYAKFRNPFNHPSVMFRKKAVLEAGNYTSLYRLEDYDLWVRMLSKGTRCFNIGESLVKMRVSKDFYRRRGGIENLKSHLHLKGYMLKSGQIDIFEYLVGCFLMLGRACCPGFIKQILYKITLRK